MIQYDSGIKGNAHEAENALLLRNRATWVIVSVGRTRRFAKKCQYPLGQCRDERRRSAAQHVRVIVVSSL
jgi:hypothetical protein